MPDMVESDHSCVEPHQGAQVEVISKRLHVGKHLAAAHDTMVGNRVTRQ